MTIDLKNAFRLSFVTGETELPIPAASEILARLRAGSVWDVASIAPAADQFPLLHVEWHEGHGFVIQCYEDEHAWSDFLLAGPRCGPPTIEFNLGGQALERWPSELFVPEELARQALDCFLATGKQDLALHWVRIDAFPRTTIWEGREGREAWERANSGTKRQGPAAGRISRRALGQAAEARRPRLSAGRYAAEIGDLAIPLTERLRNPFGVS